MMSQSALLSSRPTAVGRDCSADRKRTFAEFAGRTGQRMAAGAQCVRREAGFHAEGMMIMHDKARRRGQESAARAFPGCPQRGCEGYPMTPYNQVDNSIKEILCKSFDST